jgi:uncharacterized membrane protein YjgN (DUF898 family)
MGKVGGSRFRVQACPGAIGCGYEIIFIFYLLGYYTSQCISSFLAACDGISTFFYISDHWPNSAPH